MAALIEGRAVLIVIDLQERFRSRPGFAEQVERVAQVIDACRAAGVPVVFTQELHRPGLVDFGRALDGDEGLHCLEGDPGTELVEELRPREGEHVIAKRRYSCFFGTDLEILLRDLNVQTLLLAGGLTDVGVHYTFADARQRDYQVRVLEDCLLGSAAERHDAALTAMEYLQQGARRTSQDVLATLGGLAQPALDPATGATGLGSS
jgi:nicotinamidase-related amidase